MDKKPYWETIKPICFSCKHFKSYAPLDFVKYWKQLDTAAREKAV